MNTIKAHKLSIYNKDSVAQSNQCGCFHCLSLFAAQDVKEWVDDGRTALCPHCSIDSVLTDDLMQLTPEFLKEMQNHWFSKINARELK